VVDIDNWTLSHRPAQTIGQLKTLFAEQYLSAVPHAAQSLTITRVADWKDLVDDSTTLREAGLTSRSKILITSVLVETHPLRNTFPIYVCTADDVKRTVLVTADDTIRWVRSAATADMQRDVGRRPVPKVCGEVRFKGVVLSDAATVREAGLVGVGEVLLREVRGGWCAVEEEELEAPRTGEG
jgi:hypothetical protein